MLVGVTVRVGNGVKVEVPVTAPLVAVKVGVTVRVGDRVKVRVQVRVYVWVPVTGPEVIVNVGVLVCVWVLVAVVKLQVAGYLCQEGPYS
mgnify:CR=1 FL=1